MTAEVAALGYLLTGTALLFVAELIPLDRPLIWVRAAIDVAALMCFLTCVTLTMRATV